MLILRIIFFIKFLCFNIFKGESPLHLAAAQDRYEIGKLLVENGANVNSQDNYICYFIMMINMIKNNSSSSCSIK